MFLFLTHTYKHTRSHVIWCENKNEFLFCFGYDAKLPVRHSLNNRWPSNIIKEKIQKKTKTSRHQRHRKRTNFVWWSKYNGHTHTHTMRGYNSITTSKQNQYGFMRISIFERNKKLRLGWKCLNYAEIKIVSNKERDREYGNG